MFLGDNRDAYFYNGHGFTRVTLEFIMDALRGINPPINDVEFVGVYFEAHIAGTI